MNYPGSQSIRAQQIAEHLASELDGQAKPLLARSLFSWLRRSRLEREKFRLERDTARGYSINVKQVCLAFAVEFMLIGLILISQVLYAVEAPDTSGYAVYSALLYPIALATVELARVPLAIAVRTQNSWNIQFAALLGVACAVTVTSVSLTQIGHYTFNPRLEKVYEKRKALVALEDEKKTFDAQRASAQVVVDQKIQDWKVLSDQLNTLSGQLNGQSNQSCIPIQKRNPDGSETTVQSCKENPALAILRREIATVNSKRAETEASGRQAQAELAKFDPRPINDRISKANSEYADAINQSQMHSYTAMLFRKDPHEVSEGEVKTLQWYMIVIPSIAAALSSTLIAMTAVRRIRRRPENVATLPEEATAYLFGPLLTALRKEAAEAVNAAIKTSERSTKAPESPKASEHAPAPSEPVKA